MLSGGLLPLDVQAHAGKVIIVAQASRVAQDVVAIAVPGDAAPVVGAHLLCVCGAGPTATHLALV